MKTVKIMIITAILAVGIYVANMDYQTIYAAPVVTAPSAPVAQYINVSALELVSNPYKYAKRNVRVRGKFDKFSTLGLDYPPAMRSHDNYISFMIQRPDITDHNIPLSELKIFLKKDVAEKHIDLDAGDEVEFTGKIFSTALGDPWMDVDSFKVINKAKKDTKK